MSDGSAIEWTDASWNPVRGCSRISRGCGGSDGGGCYAERVAARFSGPGKPYEGLARFTPGGPRWTGKIRLVPELLEQPLRWRKPRRIFVNSMSDLFHEDVPDGFIETAFGVMSLAGRHTFQILTKRAERMRRWMARATLARCQAAATVAGIDIWTPARRLERADEKVINGPWPLPNVWLGVSVEDQAAADARIPHLLATPAAVRFLSCEPLLGPVDLDGLSISPVCEGCHEQPLASALSASERCACCGEGPEPIAWPGLDWVIVGGESGPRARPLQEAWVRSLLEQCDRVEIPAFVKQLGAAWTAPSYPLSDPKGAEPEEWPSGLRIRQMPEAR